MSKSTLLLLLLAPCFLVAQAPAEKIRITGKVIDRQTQMPLEFATVAVLRLPDSVAVTGGLTGTDGAFRFQVEPGQYFLKADFLGYKTQFSNPIDLRKFPQRVYDAGQVTLEPSAQALDEVVISAEKSQLQFSLDKRVFNVGKDLVNKGGSAADVLDNVPSVTVDAEGGVSLRGSENVRILIDGKPSGLVSFGANGLRQLPANLIDRVEVITNPSARYEAEGMSGIINIVLKKDQSPGLNGAVDLTLGHPAEYGAAVNANYRKNRLNFFGNYSLRYNKSPGSGGNYQEFYSGDTTFITGLDRARERGGLSNNVRLGVEYFFNEKSSLNSAFSWRYSDQNNFSEIVYRDFLNSKDNPTGTTLRTDDEREIEPNLEYSLNYKKTFLREGHELNAEFRFQDNSEQEQSDFVERHFLPGGAASGQPDLLQQSDNREKERNLITQVDYVRPFGKDGKFEAGYRGGIRTLRNRFLVEQWIDAGWQTLPGLSNELLYDENIQAVYGIAGNKINRFSWQGGLRLEVSDIRTELVQTGAVNARPLYANLFPSAHLGYEFGAQNALQVSYSRRIRRPHFRELNPFYTYSDARNFSGGNPNLNPEYTDAYEIGHLKRWEKGTLGSSLYFRHTTDVVERIRFQLSDTSSVTQPVNLSNRDEYGLECTASAEPFSFWKLNGNVNFFRALTSGAYEGQDFSADAFSWFGRLSSRLTLWKKVDVQTTFHYRAPRNTPQGRSKAMYHADLGASVDVLQNKGTLTLSIRDVFNTRRWRSVTQGEDFYTEGDFQWRARQVSMTFSYRLNRNKEQKPEREPGGGDGQEY